MTDTTRRFSFSHPTRYQGQTYPTAEADIDYGDGTAQQGRIFADANGIYHTLDAEGNILDATPVHGLDEVVVTAPRRDNLLSDAFNRFLTESNDNAMVSNTAHRQYNTHLEENALQGAKAHALWDKEHLNLAAWRDAATAVPFAVAATPLAVGAGKAVIGTAAGQAARNGLVALMGNPVVDAANTALGLGFAGKGAYDISQGEFTPGTAMDLTGGLGLMAKGSSMFDRFLTARKVTRNTDNASTVDNVFNNIKNDWPLKGETEIPLGTKAEAAKKYTDFIYSKDYQDRLQRAGLESHWDYMKDLTDSRVNNVGYFPGKVRAEIKNDPDILGLSAVEPSSPNYGITLQEDLPSDEVRATLMHEISHWATGNAGVNDIANSVKYPFRSDPNVNYIGDIMRYNEDVVPNIPWDDILNNMPKSMSVDKLTELEERYRYLTAPTEKRARAMSVYQQAKDSDMSTDDFVDKYTNVNGRIAHDAPLNLQQLGEILTTDNIKKYLKNFLSVAAPVGIAASSKNK